MSSRRKSLKIPTPGKIVYSGDDPNADVAGVDVPKTIDKSSAPINIEGIDLLAQDDR
jgi:hypothetical protein